MMRMIFIFGFAKKYLQRKKLCPIKVAIRPSRSGIRRSYQEIQRDHEGALYTHAIVPL